jgi:hypothetical protein
LGANSVFFFQATVLSTGLASLFWALRVRHLGRKVLGWGYFHSSVLFMWISTYSAYHDQLNPFPLSVVVVAAAAWFVTMSVMWVLALGVLKRQGTLEPEDKA